MWRIVFVLHKACFSCHEPAKDPDFVFVHYTPTP